MTGQRASTFFERKETIMVRVSKGWLGFLLAATGALAIAGSLAAADDAPVSGVFKANGQEAKLAYLSASKGEPFADKPTIVLIFTEKDHAKDKKPDIGAMFGKYGSALIITINEDGKIVGCQVAHSALKKGAFNSIGTIKMSDYKLADGKMQGKLSTGGESETFGDKWEVDIKFQAPAP
jgi:hypothetical protein